MKSRKLACVVALMLFAAVPTALASTTWYVNGVSGSDTNNCLSARTACKTIGHAISLAQSGDLISVAAATYKENLSVPFNLTIAGAATTTTIIDGGSAGRVVTISDQNTHVQLSNLTLRNGHAIYGAGILNYGNLTLSHTTLTGNTVTSSDKFGDSGGAISNIYPATLTITSSTISNNTVTSKLNASLGGGIVNSGTLTISNSTISGNSVSGVGYNGGANHSGGAGIFSRGTLRINNSTLSGNIVHAGAGGGISNSGTLALNNTTISGNSATSGGGIANTGAATVENSIVANSAGGNCAGRITSKGYNISSDSSCDFSGAGDKKNTNPMLGPLQNNGGPTQTMALSSGSPAIDAGNPAGCTDDLGHLLKTDQRGLPRPDKEDTSGCDMGAYERQSDDVSLLPSSLHFLCVPFPPGPCQCQTPRDATLKDLGDTAVTVTSIHIGGEGFTQSNHCPRTLEAGESCAIGVSWKPTTRGYSRGLLSVGIEGLGSPKTVSLLGYASCLPGQP